MDSHDDKISLGDVFVGLYSILKPPFCQAMGSFNKGKYDPYKAKIT